MGQRNRGGCPILPGTEYGMMAIYSSLMRSIRDMAHRRRVGRSLRENSFECLLQCCGMLKNNQGQSQSGNLKPDFAADMLPIFVFQFFSTINNHEGTYAQNKVQYLDLRRYRVLQSFKLSLAMSGLPAAKLRHAAWICLDATYSRRSSLSSGDTSPACSAFRAEVTKIFSLTAFTFLQALFELSV
jgi:hypothetical protein